MNDELFLDERITVVAVFSNGHHPCRPVRFRRANGREVAITDVGLGYPVPRGSRTVHIFDVTDGQSEYRLELDAQTLRWRLVREVAYSGE